jgi:hypothetical protein
MRFAHLVIALAFLLPASHAFAWPYEVYPAPKDFSGYRVAAHATVKGGTAELLLDDRITDANTAKVRTILLGGDSGDPALQDAIERDDPRWAVVRFTPSDGGQTEVMVLDHALASLTAADIQGDGDAKLEVTIDYLQPHRGRSTFFMEPINDKLEPVQYVDAVDHYKMQIELIDADKAWWKQTRSGKAAEFLLVDGRFPDRTDLMRIHWNGKLWLRTQKMLPPGAVATAAGFPAADAFP